METDESVLTFARAYAAIYHRFHRRVPPGTYRPSREALAVLRHLRDIGPLTVGEAAKHFQRSQAAISEVINRLISRGLLERMQDARDKRRHLVWLSTTGERLLEREGQVLSVDLVAHAFEQMAPDDRHRLAQGLDALLATIPSQTANPS